MNTVIFRRALPFVYGLTNSSQKPERQKYTDTIREFERRAPNHYRGRREKCSRSTRTDLRKTETCTREKEKTARKTAGDIAKNHCHAGPGRPAYEYDVRPRHLSEPENG